MTTTFDPPLCDLCGIGGGMHDGDCPHSARRLARAARVADPDDDPEARGREEDRYLQQLLGEPVRPLGELVALIDEGDRWDAWAGWEIP